MRALEHQRRSLPQHLTIAELASRRSWSAAGVPQPGQAEAHVDHPRTTSSDPYPADPQPTLSPKKTKGQDRTQG